MKKTNKDLNIRLNALQDQYLFGTITLKELVQKAAAAGLDAAQTIIITEYIKPIKEGKK